MKNIFSVEIKDNENSIMLGEHFITKRIDEDLQRRYEESLQKSEHYEKKASLPSWLNLVKHVVCGFSIIVTISIINSIAEIGAEAFKNAPGIFIGCLVGWAIYLTLFFVEKGKKKNVENDESFQQSAKEDDELIKECLRNLNVPEDCVRIDFFGDVYKVKNGKEKNAFPLANYLNFNYYSYIEDGKLCFSDQTSVITIPFYKVKKLIKYEKKVSFYGWHKVEQPNHEKYKEYKLTVSNMGQIFTKSYYAIEFESDNETYEIVFPPYELNEISKLIDIENIEKEIIKK